MPSDRVATPLEKLNSFRQEHFVTGVEFDEKKVREVIGLDPVPNPEYLEMSPGRRRLVRMGDREAEAELRAESARAAERMAAVNAKNSELGMKDARIAELEAQLREARENNGDVIPRRPQMAPPAMANADAGGSKIADDAVPTQAWTIRQIVEWEAQQGYVLPPKKGFGMSKLDVLEHAMAQHKKAAEPQE